MPKIRYCFAIGLETAPTQGRSPDINDRRDRASRRNGKKTRLGRITRHVLCVFRLQAVKAFFVGMTITKTKKVSIAKKLTDAFKNVQSIVFVHFKGLPVFETNAMRKELRARSVGYTVAKKTLVKRALNELSLKGEMPPLEGEIALAYGEDPVTPASSILEFAKKYKEQLSIVGGVFEGRYQNKMEMEVIASIPPMQTLRGMFVNVLNSPIAGLVVALKAIADKKAV